MEIHYYHGKTFHKLSYPAVVDPFDTSKVYNGDTLYYQSGQVNNYQHNYMKLGSQNAWGVPGQSGSSIFYTNNIDERTVVTMRLDGRSIKNVYIATIVKGWLDRNLFLLKCVHLKMI